MKTTYKHLLLLPIILFTAFSLSGCGYNTLVTMEEEVDNAWAQVENQYQRRADLIPNLVNTVKGYADFEKSVLTEVTEARSKVSQMQINADDLSDPQKFQQFQDAQDQLSGALSRLLVTVEAYPDLKANQNFLALQAQLEGTENRISVERMRFNDAVRAYNTEIRSFPTLITAGIFGFSEKQYFKSKEGSDQVPEVDFSK